MTIVCRLLQLSSEVAYELAAGRLSLAEAQASSRSHSDVYRYWHGIDALLRAHAPNDPAVRWRQAGREIAPLYDALPPARVLSAADVVALAAALRDIEPDALAPHYDPQGLDTAQVYPACWVAWEETFSALGQMLEHYHFLRMFAEGAAGAGAGALWLYEDDGEPVLWEDDG